MSPLKILSIREVLSTTFKNQIVELIKVYQQTGYDRVVFRVMAGNLNEVYGVREAIVFDWKS